MITGDTQFSTQATVQAGEALAALAYTQPKLSGISLKNWRGCGNEVYLHS
jgi:hypothetical protein